MTTTTTTDDNSTNQPTNSPNNQQQSSSSVFRPLEGLMKCIQFTTPPYWQRNDFWNYLEQEGNQFFNTKPQTPQLLSQSSSPSSTTNPKPQTGSSSSQSPSQTSPPLTTLSQIGARLLSQLMNTDNHILSTMNSLPPPAPTTTSSSRPTRTTSSTSNSTTTSNGIDGQNAWPYAPIANFANEIKITKIHVEIAETILNFFHLDQHDTVFGDYNDGESGDGGLGTQSGPNSVSQGTIPLRPQTKSSNQSDEVKEGGKVNEYVNMNLIEFPLGYPYIALDYNEHVHIPAILQSQLAVATIMLDEMASLFDKRFESNTQQQRVKNPKTNKITTTTTPHSPHSTHQTPSPAISHFWLNHFLPQHYIQPIINLRDMNDGWETLGPADRGEDNDDHDGPVIPAKLRYLTTSPHQPSQTHHSEQD
jgi:hypothetical protein